MTIKKIITALIAFILIFSYIGDHDIVWRQVGYQTIKLSSGCTDNIIKLVTV